MELNKIIAEKEDEKIKLEYPNSLVGDKMIKGLKNKGYKIKEVEYSRWHKILNFFTDENYSQISLWTFLVFGWLIGLGYSTLPIILGVGWLIWAIFEEKVIRRKFNLEL